MIMSQTRSSTYEEDFDSFDDDGIDGFDDSEQSLDRRIFFGSYNSTSFNDDVKKLVLHYLESFFSKERLFCGGPIPKQMLRDDERIAEVLNLSLSDAVNLIYEATEICRDAALEAEARRIGDATDDVKVVNETLKRLSRAGIPQEFSGGLLLAYFELCLGFDVRR